MKYVDLVSLLSEARMSKYNRVTHGDKVRTVQLYHHNLKLSQRLFGVIGMFDYAYRLYTLIRTYLEYMGYDADKVLKIVEKPDGVLRDIERLAEELRV